MIYLGHEAKLFARAAHAAVGQKRKYTGEAYHVHPEAVAGLLTAYIPRVTSAMIEAAHLHDVLEDTQVPEQMILSMFGYETHRLVVGLTEPKTHTGNRIERKTKEMIRLSQTCPDTKTIKLADLIDNTSSINRYDAKFSVTYMAEKRQLLDYALQQGNPVLWHLADTIVKNYYKGLLA